MKSRGSILAHNAFLGLVDQGFPVLVAIIDEGARRTNRIDAVGVI